MNRRRRGEDEKKTTTKSFLEKQQKGVGLRSSKEEKAHLDWAFGDVKIVGEEMKVTYTSCLLGKKGGETARELRFERTGGGSFHIRTLLV